MKKYINRVVQLVLLSFLVTVFPGTKAGAQDVNVSYQSFYDNLSPYGQWVSDPSYGNVWVPNEGGDFRPYGSRGHWAMTDYGNTWVSEDPWGWACYHYGRWTYNPYYGWVWVPGYEWAPAWVSWRYGGGQCGWAPLGPGVSIGESYYCPDSWWVFVGPQYMYRQDCFNYWRGPGYNNTYIHQTTIINNYYRDNGTQVRYNYGPRAEQITAVTHQPVQVYRVSQASRPGAASLGAHTLNIYRPAVNRTTASTARPSNLMQAPKPIGRPQAATNTNATRQPAFRQQVQQHTAASATGNMGRQTTNPPNGNTQNGRMPANDNTTQGRGMNTTPANRQAPMNNQAQNRPQAAPNTTPARQPQNFNQGQNRPQPAPVRQLQNYNQEQNRPQPAPARQPQNYNQGQNRPQPTYNNDQVPARQPQNYNQGQNRPHPSYNNNPAPARQPQNYNQQPQGRPAPEQQHYQPAPQQQQHYEPAPQPQRSQPAPMQRQAEPSRPQPMQAPREEQHEGGRR